MRLKLALLKTPSSAYFFVNVIFRLKPLTSRVIKKTISVQYNYYNYITIHYNFFFFYHFFYCCGVLTRARTTKNSATRVVRNIRLAHMHTETRHTRVPVRSLRSDRCETLLLIFKSPPRSPPPPHPVTPPGLIQYRAPFRRALLKPDTKCLTDVVSARGGGGALLPNKLKHTNALNSTDPSRRFTVLL